MLAYTVRRLLYAVPTLFGITLIAFLIIHLVPGDPGRVALGFNAPPSAVEAFDHELGLDRPLLTQYWLFIEHAARLDFGESLSLRVPVTAGIAEHTTTTLILVAYVLLLAVGIAVPVSVFVSTREGGVIDHVVRVLGLLTYVMPAFWLGLLFVLVFSFKVKLFPVSGAGTGVIGTLHSLTLPAITLGVALAPLFIRTLRASLLATLQASHVEAARSRGFSSRRVLYRHALRPSCTSLVTLIGLTAGGLFSGTVVIERVFGLDGLGSILVNGVGARDYPLVQGLVVVIGAGVVAINLLTDLTYAFLDPRVRLGAVE